MKTNLLIIIYGLIVTMSVMYATQPLQPLLASKFNISIIEASQFTAVILFFLAVAPIIYGYILEKVNDPNINSSEFFYGTKEFTAEQTRLFEEYYNKHCLSDLVV